MNTVLNSLNRALHRAFEHDPTVLMIGEDILDPYGGAFKIAQGLSEAYPERVLTSPVSEAGITGVATGLALRGYRPVVEIMFGDFITLVADQLINSAAKFRWMYADRVQVPLVLRTPMGGRRGYGPTHSQTLEKLFLGVPGISVLAPSAMGDPGSLLFNTILHTEDPVLFVENKLLYLAPTLGSGVVGEFSIEELPTGMATEMEIRTLAAPTYRVTLRGAPPASLTLAAYGYMAELARQALQKLAYEHEIFAELVVPTRLSPFDASPFTASVRKTGRLLVVEEGTLTLGWGAEVLAQVSESVSPAPKRVSRIAAQETPIPAAPGLEEAALPGVGDIVQAAISFFNRSA